MTPEMNEIDEVLTRANHREIIFFLLYNGERRAKDFPNPTPLGKRDDQSFETFLERMHGICPRITAHDNKVLEIMLDFSSEQREIYMELGFISGFELYRQMMDERKNL